MATIYCRSTDGDDADNGTTWALAKATLQSAITAAGNGGTVYVSKNHAEYYSGNTTLQGPTTPANQCSILAVDDAGDPEPPTALVNKDSASTATVGYNVSGNGTLTLAGFMYIYGITFAQASASTNQVVWIGVSLDAAVTVEDSYLNMQASGASGGYIRLGGSSNLDIHRFTRFINCDFTSASPTQCFDVDAGAYLGIDGGSLLGVGTSVSVFALNPGADRASEVDVSDFDMSAVTADDYIIDVANETLINFNGRRLKFPASYSGIVSDITALQVSSKPNIKIHSYGTGDEYYQFYEAGYTGEIEESTAVYRTGGATYDGTNEFSAKLIASANANYAFPLRFKLAELKLDLTSAKTLTVHTAQNAGTVYQDDEFWLELEYPDATDLALGTFDNSSRAGSLDTPANLTSSTESWTASGSEDKRKVAVTISSITGATDAQVTVWACLGKASGEIYVCPKVEVT